MGIKHLQSFMIKCVPNGFVDVSIIEECEKFKNESGNQPIIVVDLMSLFAPVLQGQNNIILCGGRHNLYKEFFEELLTKLSKHAELVFYKDGPIPKEKYDTWFRRQEERYQITTAIIEKINEGYSLDHIIQYNREIPTINSHLLMMESVARKFGKFYLSVTRDCDAEIARYASKNKNVIAVLAEDSDFLIFAKGENNWRCFSVNHLDPITLYTKEYNRKALKNYLKLDDSELVILSTLGGNDIIQFDKLIGFHRSFLGYKNDYAKRFPELANCIRALPKNHYDLIRTIANRVFRNTYEETLKKIEDSLNQYDLNFTPMLPANPLLRYCTEENFEFTASILKKITKNLPLSYYDMKIRKPNLYEVMIKLFCKQIGIVLVSEASPIDYKVTAKASHEDKYRVHCVSPIKPDGNLPPFAEILKRNEYPQHDEIRFKLLKWMVCENLRDRMLQSIPQKYLIDILVLIFMVNEKFIKPFEADIIFLSIKQVEDDKSDLKNLMPPKVLNGRAFQIAFLFTKLHMLIKRSFEVTGLIDLSSLLNFDGVLFHNLYLKHINDPLVARIELGFELIQYCYYNHIED